MNTIHLKYIKAAILIGTITFLLPLTLDAQRMQHRAGGGGMSRPSNMSRPSGGSGYQNRSINGGAQRPTNYNTNRSKPANNYNKPSTGNVNTRPANKGGSNKPSTSDVKRPSNSGNTKDRANKGKINTNDKKVNTGDRNINSGNRNVNIDNSRNINVNGPRYGAYPPPRPYPRPPYVYGGFHYNCYHPYHYHPYTPYYYGPSYNPWGFFVAALAVTAVVITVNNQQYKYDQGVYYVASDGGYTVVQAPVGATITTLPPNTQTVVVNETTNNYYYAGTYYEKEGNEYVVVPPTAGTVVENLPEGGEQIKIGDITYVKFGDIYYQPIVQDGEDMYEVVDVTEAS